MAATNNRFAHVLAGWPDLPRPPLYPGRNVRGVPLDDVLESHSGRVCRVLRRIRSVGTGAARKITGDDLVHTDYTYGNVLFDEAGQVSGVVDWNFGVARGEVTATTP